MTTIVFGSETLDRCWHFRGIRIVLDHDLRFLNSRSSSALSIVRLKERTEGWTEGWVEGWIGR